MPQAPSPTVHSRDEALGGAPASDTLCSYHARRPSQRRNGQEPVASRKPTLRETFGPRARRSSSRQAESRGSILSVELGRRSPSTLVGFASRPSDERARLPTPERIRIVHSRIGER